MNYIDPQVLVRLLAYVMVRMPGRTMVIHCEASEAVALLKAGSQLSTRLMISFTATETAPASHSILVFLPQQVLNLSKNKTARASAATLHITHDNVLQLPNHGITLQANYKDDHCVLYQQVPFTESTEMAKLAYYDSSKKEWETIREILEPRMPVTTNALQGKVVTLLVNSINNNLTRQEAVNNYARTMGAFYWGTLRQHFQFRFEFQFTKAEEFNNVRNDIGVFRNAGADGMGNLFIMDTQRTEILDFVLLGLDVKYHLIIRRPEYSFSWLGLIQPFRVGVWISVLFNIIVLSIVLYIQFRMAPHSPYAVSWPATLFMAVGFACNQVNIRHLRDLSGQLACIFSLFYLLTINQFYVSTLYAILSTAEASYPFVSLEEFVSKDTHRLIISPDTAAYGAFPAAKEGILRTVWEQFLLPDKDHQMTGSNALQQVRRLCHENAAVFALPLQMSQYSKTQCPLQFVPQGYLPLNMGIVVRKNFPYTALFRQMYLKAVESGVSQYLKKHLVSSLMPPMSKRSSLATPTAITLQQVLFPFAVLAGGLMLALMFITLEVICIGVETRYRNNRVTSVGYIV